MTILIFSELGDAHAITVQMALEAHGIKCLRVTGDAFPQHLDISLEIEQHRHTLTFPDNDLNNVDTVWLRRRATPKQVSPRFDEADRAIALQEADEFWKAFQYGCFPAARWINSIESKLRAQSKIYQLDVAKKSGFCIPRTLFSNQPSVIRKFVAEEKFCIFKPFSSVSWTASEKIIALYASPVKLGDLPEDEALRNAPGIFQQAIPKAFELRITYMNGRCIAAKILSQHRDTNPQDWRLGYYGKIQVEPYTLPVELEQIIVKFMQAMHLSFGALDVIYSTDGRWYFLEVNESGQFLWLEGYNPEIQLLREFCIFLSGKTDLPDELSLASIRQQFPAIQTADQEKALLSTRA